ncbi:MAG: PAS domain S-box protein, partial [Candidatus Hydrogenedentes bacterium]|nr:PAS domain S-box protein [Candidatus Hydrogenedentota bacterium]
MRKNAEFLRGILDTSASGVFVADREGIIVFANPRTQELSGLSVEESIGRSCLVDAWPLRDFSGRRIPTEEDPFLRVRDTGQRIVKRGVIFPRTDGSLRYHVINAAPLRDRYGKISHVVFGVQDITEQKHAEEAYRVLVEDSPQGLSLFQDGRVVYVNPFLAEMMGCRAEDLIGLSVDEAAAAYIHPEDRDAPLRAHQAVIYGDRSPQSAVYRVMHRDGGVRYFESYVSLTRFEGRPAVQIINLDVTEWQEAEKALEETRRNLEELFNRIEDFVFVLSLEGRIVHVNPAVINRLGYSEKELGGSPVTIVHPAERRAEAQEIVNEILTGKRSSCDVPLQTADGRIIPVETKVAYGVWNGKQVLYGVSRDISERLEAEEKIREGERRFTEALDATGHVLYRFNVRENRYDYLSPHIEAFTGYSHEEFMSKGLGDIVKEIHPDDWPRLQQAMKDAAEKADGDSASLSIEVRRRFKDGKYHWLNDSMTLFLGPDRCVNAIVGSVCNIEDRKRAEEALRESEERFRLLANNSVDMISRHAPDGTVLFASPSS